MKHNSFRSLWWVISLQLKNSKGYFAWAVFYSIYNGTSSVASVYASAKFITSVTTIATERVVPSDTYLWLGIIFGLQILSAVCNACNRIIERRIQQKMDLTVNGMLMTKMYELSQEQFDDETFNTKLARARDSLSSMWRLTTQVSWMVSSVVRFVSAISAILFVAPIVGLIITIMVIPVTYFRAKQNKKYEEINKRIEPIDRVAFRTRWIMIDPNTMPEIRLMNGFGALIKLWRRNLSKSQDIIFEADKQLAPIDIGSDIVEPMVSFGATIYFLKLLIGGTIGLDRFIFLRGLLDQASNAASSIVSSFQQLHETSIEMQNFNEIYKAIPAIPNGTVSVQAPLTIEFKDVTFAYPGTDKNILKNISFLIVPGSKLALVGENGAGKSTLIKLLMRQYLPTKGQILINGIDIKNVEQVSYYEAVSNLSQEFLILHHLTIRENLVVGIERTIDQKEIDSVAKMVGADTFVNKLKHKYDERLDSSFDDGTHLSGGQMQRLGVARALLRAGDIMLLDEPTSAIDAKAEYMIFNNIYKQHDSKTTLIVSHRFSTVRKADKIIVMENGQITEYGSHEELLKHGGLYKEMFETQAEGYK